MPPVGPQGSRGGLITAVVVFTIGFVTSTILAIYYGVALSKAQDQYKTTTDRQHQYYVDTASPQVQRLLQLAKTNVTLREHTALAASIWETQELAKTLVGEDSASTTRPTSAIDKARDALQAARDKLTGIQLPPDIVGAIDALTSYAANQHQQVTDLRDTQVVAATDAAERIKQAEVLTEKAQEDVAAASKVKQQALDDAQKAHQDYQKRAAEDHQLMDKQSQEFNAALRKYEVAEADLNKKIDAQNKVIDDFKARLSPRRVAVEEPIMRQADGQILSVASDDVVYINLGRADHIVEGMTFEVYDRRTGVPKLGDGMNKEDMPVGLASIEVERVNADSSQCRATLQPNQHISQGDLIANLIYDRNIKYNFFIYGKFDLAQMNHPNDGDRNKIMDLVHRWGGRIQHQINVDTDFVILGAEPTVEDFTDEQLQDPFYVRRKSDEEAELNAYNALLTQARDLHIPVMNQNRFLYFIGYYEAAQR